MLLNFTNHPSNIWSEKQKRTAIQLFGKVVDMPFPHIDESADESYISKLADEYLQKILLIAERENVVVHLMGEQTFAYSLVKRLKNRNINCVASTTKRIVNMDSSGQKKEVIFQFERFRYYE